MKPLKVSLIALGVACVFFAAAVMYQKTDTEPQIVGGYTFAKSYGKLGNNNKIVLDDGQNRFSLVMQDGNWRVAERNMYYADHNVVNFLLSVISRSRIKNFQADSNEDFEFVPEWNISIYDGQKVLDEVEVKKTPDGLYLGKVGGDNTIYELTGYFDFPHEYGLWFTQPLVSIKADDIYEITYGDNFARRSTDYGNFILSKEEDRDILPTAIGELAYLDFSNAVKTDDIKEKADAIAFSIEEFSGLVYSFEIYEADGKYFAEIVLSAAAASDMGISDYVEQYKALYEGWAFELNPEKYAAFSALK